MNKLYNRLALLPRSLGVALVLVGLLGYWVLTMGLGPDSDIGGAVCGMLILGSALLGWRTALGLSRPELTFWRGLAMATMLVILHLIADGLTIIAIVDESLPSFRLASGLSQFLLLGAWLVGFNLFSRAIRHLPGRCWHFPLALALWGSSYLSFITASTLQPHLVIACLTLGIFGFWLIGDLFRRYL